jgi:hypothetical protein
MRFNRLALLSLASQAGCFTPTTNNLPSTTTDTDPDQMGSTGGLADSGSEGEPESTGTGIEPSESGSADTTTTSTESIGSSSETTTEGSLCGNGTVDAGEECDNGKDNAVDEACLPDCVLNVCGDGMQGPDEACDHGPENELEVGACAPDCSRVIETRAIVPSDLIADGDLGNNPVATADAACPAGHDALFVVPGVREASDAPYAADSLLDWPLQPYTAYANNNGTIVWITDDVPLLGVRDGGPEPLLAPLYECPAGQTCYGSKITGLDADWTAATSQTCNGWLSSSDDDEAVYGDPQSVTEYISTGDVHACGFGFISTVGVYCVEL